MMGGSVPDGDHVTRLCSGSHFRPDGTLAPSAFKLRQGETYLSVNWLEHLSLGSRAAELAEVRRVLATKRAVGASARLALLNVGQMRDAVRHARAVEVFVRHEPETRVGQPFDPSHSGIYGLFPDDVVVPEVIVGCVLDFSAAR